MVARRLLPLGRQPEDRNLRRYIAPAHSPIYQLIPTVGASSSDIVQKRTPAKELRQIRRRLGRGDRRLASYHGLQGDTTGGPPVATIGKTRKVLKLHGLAIILRTG
jgi:hypothetical protein